jgi:4-hydroxyphenylacetate 3-monooxygenase
MSIHYAGTLHNAPRRASNCSVAFDAAVASFSGRQQLYERYYSGDPARLAGTLYAFYDKDTHIDRIFGLLDDLERRQRLAGAASHN